MSVRKRQHRETEYKGAKFFCLDFMNIFNSAREIYKVEKRENQMYELTLWYFECGNNIIPGHESIHIPNPT